MSFCRPTVSFHKIYTNFSEHAVVLDSIIGWESSLGSWCRVEGILPKVNPNTPNSRIESDRLFDNKGKFMSQCAVLGRGVSGQFHHLRPKKSITFQTFMKLEKSPMNTSYVTALLCRRKRLATRVRTKSFCKNSSHSALYSVLASAISFNTVNLFKMSFRYYDVIIT